MLRKGTMFSEISQGPIRLRRCKESTRRRTLACACMLPFVLTVAGSVWAQSSIDESRASSEAQSDVPSEAQSDVPSEDPSSPPDAADTTPGTDELPSGSSQEPSRGFLEIGLHASEGVDTNPAGILGSSSQLSSLTHLFGSLDSAGRSWPRSLNRYRLSGRVARFGKVQQHLAITISSNSVCANESAGLEGN